MHSTAAFVLFLLWSLVEVHSQMFPHISFMGETLPNHTYVDLTLVGAGTGEGIQCRTDLSNEGPLRGDWFFPDGTVLPFSGGGNVYQVRLAQGVELRRTSDGNSPSGIYRCIIPTFTVNDENDSSVGEYLYAGVYATGGDITMTDIEVTAGSSQFTLTCNSTGGPATTVIWTRDSVTVFVGTETVLDDPVTAQYTHTLTGSAAGVYTCTVANDKPSNATLSISLLEPSAPTDVEAYYVNATSIHVSWTPPSPLGGTTGYRIDYDGGSVDVSGGSTDNHTLTNLDADTDYRNTITVAGISQYFNTSDSEQAVFPPPSPTITTLGDLFGAATYVILYWTVPSGTEVDYYEVTWQRDTSGVCSDEDKGNTTLETHALIITTLVSGLEENSSYFITVTAGNSVGSAVSDRAAMTTREAAPSAAPTSVNITSMNSSSITVQWGPVDCIHRNGDITGYMLFYNEQDSIDNITSVSVTASSTGGGTYTIAGLDPSVVYNLQIAAINSAGIGEKSQNLSIQINYVETPVLMASATATSVTLSWTSGGSEGVSYEVMWQRDTSVGCSYVDGDSATITDGSTSYDITGLEEDSSYNITVRASNTAGSTAVSNTVTVMTPEAAPSAAPTSVSITPMNSSSITVQWGPVDCIHRNGDITGYITCYNILNNSGSQHCAPSNDSEIMIDNLDPYATYTIRVRAVNSVGLGPSSDNITTSNLIVGFVETRYTVAEGETGEVCVHLISTGSDVGDTFNILLEVEVNNDPLSIPTNATKAIPDTIDPFGYYNMDDNADYPPPIKGRRYQIRESAITSMTQTVCYDQTIYTDDRNETDEYFSLTLTIQENSDPRTVVDAVLGSTIFKIMNNENIQVTLTGLFVCTEWVVYTGDQNIKNAITSELSVSCKCGITVDNFDNEQLTCSNKSLNTVSYQAQIMGSADINSTTIVSLIEDWIASTPAISVLGVLVGVGEECTVDVTDLSSGVCTKRNETPTCGSTPTDQTNQTENITDQPTDQMNQTEQITDQPTDQTNQTEQITDQPTDQMNQTEQITDQLTDQTAQTDTSSSDSCTDVSAAIGIAVAVGMGVVLLSGVTITVMTVCIFKRKKQHQHSYSLKTSEELYSIPNSMHFNGTTRPNVAYNITTRGGERDSDLDNSYDYVRTLSNPPRPHLVDNGYEVDTPENIRRIRVERQPQEAGERDTQNPPKET